MLLFQILPDRTICFILEMGVYGGVLGGAVFILTSFLEKHFFEPIFFKKMIQTKLREERLFNKYLDELKP